MKTSLSLLSALLIGICLFFVSCKSNEPEPDEEAETMNYSIPVNFNSLPPEDLSATANDTELVQFAWEHFLALNWKSSFGQNGKRGTPDNNWNWSSDTLPYPDTVVWETYAHRTELRPYDEQMQAFDNIPKYSFGKTLYPATPGTSFTLFNNLDENNEIGSCDVYAHTDKYDREVMVLYQAKVNRDEYDYIYNNYNTNAKLLSATNQTLANINKYSAYYKNASSTCNCPGDSNVICLPCGGSPVPGASGTTYEGAIEIKTAWRLLVAEDDPSKFFTRPAISYELKNDSIFYYNKTFALIGIHIIHKTTNYPDFVFATWEHVDVENDNMGYVLLDSKGMETGPLYKKYARLHPIPDVVNTSTSDVHAQISAMNPNSVWLNYRLTGVQGHPTNDSTAFNFFLANYVIESDTTLADFHGNSIGTPHNELPNTLLNGQMYSMGGCKGCHGVAQTTVGSDFSFLLDQAGKPVDMPDVLDSLPPAQLSKLQKYIKATSKDKKASME